MAATSLYGSTDANEKEYKRRIWAWTMYDWANSAFATTILAAVLPVYYSQVAGVTLPSPAIATAYWTTGLSVSLLIVAVFSPILGTISDIMRGKKRFLSVFIGLGIVGTGLLVLVDTGDWLLASILFMVGRIGFAGANVFYDALLPHVARPEDLDSVSARGYAMGYLGGGLLLAVNIVMIQLLEGTWGARLSFLSVAIWWLIFSLPLFLRVPEPPSATTKLEQGETVLKATFSRLWETIRNIRQYRELFKYTIAFLIYIDGVGTIIEVAAIYGAELGFASTELILALLLVQFVGIPFALIFGRLPSAAEKRRPLFLAFIVFNMIALPVAGLAGRALLPSQVSGTPAPEFASTSERLGQGAYAMDEARITRQGTWNVQTVSKEVTGSDEADYLLNAQANDRLIIPFTGQSLRLTYSAGPDHGIMAFELDGQPLLDPGDEGAVMVDAYSSTQRYGKAILLQASQAGEHTLAVINTGDKNEASSGVTMAVAGIEILPPARQSNLLAIIGLVAGVELLGLFLVWLFGQRMFERYVHLFDTKRSILLSLVVYSVIAVWGFFLNSVVEFWFLAWMVATVQGGSQALSRSLFSMLAPKSKSGEFFGLFGVMEKFSAILGPLLFALAARSFGSSRPAILSIIAFFLIGGFLLTRVNVEAGRKAAQAEDQALLSHA
jgi:UMF1 family MFS transporter